MAADFPTSLDDLTNPSSGDNLSTSVGGLTHSALHAKLNDIVEAIEAKVGIDSSAATTSHDYLIADLRKTAKKRVHLVEDLMGSTTCFAAVTASSGSIVYTTADAGHPGIATLSTTTSASAKAMLGGLTAGNVGIIDVGDGTISFEIICRINTLSDGTETFKVRAGLMDDSGGNDGTDGIFFRYAHSANSGKWECVTRSNSTETATDSGSTVSAATWMTLRIEVNAAGTSVVFKINGATVATNTTNIPTGSARATGAATAIVKSAGTTARTYDVDLIELFFELTTERT